MVATGADGLQCRRAMPQVWRSTVGISFRHRHDTSKEALSKFWAVSRKFSFPVGEYTTQSKYPWPFVHMHDIVECYMAKIASEPRLHPQSTVSSKTSASSSLAMEIRSDGWNTMLVTLPLVTLCASTVVRLTPSQLTWSLWESYRLLVHYICGTFW